MHVRYWAEGFEEKQPFENSFNPLNAELNPICHLLALLGTYHILHVSRIRVKHRGAIILKYYSL
jgi:hypothetical protein